MDYLWFQRVSAECGCEMTAEEAQENWACVATGMAALEKGMTTGDIPEIIDLIQSFAGPEFHPGVVGFVLKQLIEHYQSTDWEDFDE